jgi:hypothetical protein
MMVCPPTAVASRDRVGDLGIVPRPVRPRETPQIFGSGLVSCAHGDAWIGNWLLCAPGGYLAGLTDAIADIGGRRHSLSDRVGYRGSVAVVEFEHEAQLELYARVEQYLRSAFGDAVSVDQDEPVFFVERAGRSFLVMVPATGPNTAVAMVYTKPAEGFAITPQVEDFLLRRGHERTPFGIVGLEEDDQITVHHVLFGETVTQETLARLLQLLAECCEELEGELESRFGAGPDLRPVS